MLENINDTLQKMTRKHYPEWDGSRSSTEDVKVRVEHWRHILGDDIDEITKAIRVIEYREKHGFPEKKEKNETQIEFAEKMGKLLWRCRQEGWYGPHIGEDGKLTFMSLFPSGQREYVRRDFIHKEGM